MRPVLLRSGGGERITIHMGGSDYETCVTGAMARLSEFVTGARIVREIDEAEAGDWFFDSSDCKVSPGGQSIGGEFTFCRREPEPDD